MDYTLYITILGVAMICGVTFFIWRKSQKKKERLVNTYTITEDMRIVPISLPVEDCYCYHKTGGQAWFISPECMVVEKSSGRTILIVDERDALPQAITKKAAKRREKYEKCNAHKVSFDVSVIGGKCFLSSMARFSEKAARDQKADFLKTCIVILTVAFGVIGLIMFVVGKL